MTRLAIIVVALCVTICASANKFSTHYIVAFDQSVGKYHADYLSPKTLLKINSILKDAQYNGDSDFLSVVGYTMEMGQPSIDRFVRPYVSTQGDTILWKNFSEPDMLSLFSKWPQGQPLFNPKGAPYGSMQSLAKPFAVIETAYGNHSHQHADRTILLIVSDDIVNGTDDNYRQEWYNVATCIGANTPIFRSMAAGVFATMQRFNDDFKFVQTSFGKPRYPISADGIYKITPYEVIPTEKPSVHSATDFPSPLPLQRVRGGFKVALNTNSINSQYTIKQITIYNRENKILASSTDGKIDRTLPSAQVNPGDTLAAHITLLLNDGLYNGARISPMNPRYRDGMATRQIVHIQDEAKVLGLFPLSDTFWWWFPNDIFTAVMLWDLLILLILIATVIYLLYYWNRKTIIYNVEHQEIALHCIQPQHDGTNKHPIS